MRRRSLILFVIVNVFVSLGVVLIVLSVLRPSNQGTTQQPMVVTVPLIITSTPDPNIGPTIIVVTATPRASEVFLPPDIETEIALQETSVPIPTLDATVLEQSVELRETTTALPGNCVPYVLQEGDTPFAIALEYGVDFEEFMAVNALTDESASFLQIGQVLIVPLEGCELTAAALSATETATLLPSQTFTPTGTLRSPTPTPTETEPITPTLTPSPTPTPSPTNTPTATIPPTAANAQVEIVQIRDTGNVTAEGVEIRNNGPVVDLSGWTLRDGEGNVYTFPNQRRLFQGGLLTVYTRVGEDTAIALFWDRTEPVWSPGETVTLIDNQGRAQSVYQIP
ncbi:MAG TPA: lamin tail domain-containing protein [Oceanobacillus sp.]|nr:lamin tail domain-containing protein [Oceanobacillus sp.]